MGTKSRLPSLSYKDVPVNGFKVLDDEQGIVEAFVAVTGNKDQGGDIIKPGAFKRSLQRRVPKGVWCVDTETEVLTERGWLRYDEIEVGDRAFSLDVGTGAARFADITAVNVFPAERRRLRHILTGGFDSLSTENHRWPVRLRNGDITWKTTAELQTTHSILRCAPRSDAVETQKWADAFVELVAWFWNEGSVDRCRCTPTCPTPRVVISQSMAANPGKCAAIRAALDSAFPGGWREHRRADGRGVEFRLLKGPSEALLAVSGQDKAPLPHFLTSLTEAQLRSFVQTCMDGDGTVDAVSGAQRWSQRSGHSLRMFEMACALAGVATNTRPKAPGVGHLGRPVSTVTLLTTDSVRPLHSIAETRRLGRAENRVDVSDGWVEYDGPVWCPTTETGTWLARRNGSVYFTGNSHNWDLPVSRTLGVEEMEPGDPRLPDRLKTGGYGALYVKTQFNLKTQRGRDAYEDVKFFGDESEWSIGYQETDAEFSKELGATLLKEIDLYEYSPVLFGMNTLTSTVSVKVAQSDEGESMQVRVSGIEDKGLEAQVAAAVKAVIDATVPAEPKGGEAEVETKVVRGSYEERTQRIMEALREEMGGDGYAFPVATFDGSVVYFAERYDDDEDEYSIAYYRATYTVDEGGVVHLGDSEQVDVVEVVVAKEAQAAAEARQKAAGSTENAPEAESAPPAETAPPATQEATPPVEGKAGRVLSQKNFDRLRNAVDLIQDVIASAGDADSDEKVVTVAAKHFVNAEGVIVDENGDPLPEGKASEDEMQEKPWHIEERDGEYCVIKDDDGKVAGCHPTRSEAEDQMAALYANEKDGEEAEGSKKLSRHDFEPSEDGDDCAKCGKPKKFWVHEEEKSAQEQHVFEPVGGGSQDAAADCAVCGQGVDAGPHMPDPDAKDENERPVTATTGEDAGSETGGGEDGAKEGSEKVVLSARELAELEVLLADATLGL